MITLIETCVAQSVRNIVGQTSTEDLNAHDNNIGTKIVAYANEKTVSKGITIVEFLIQRVAFDANIVTANEKTTLNNRKIAQEKQEEVARHARETQDANHRLALVQLENKITRAEAIAAAGDERVRLEVLIELKFSHQDIVELERNRSFAGQSHTFVGGVPIIQNSYRLQQQQQ